VRRVFAASSAFVGVIALTGAAAPAALITQAPPPFAPKGTVASTGLPLLTLQDRGSDRDGREAGSVLWNGTQSVRSGEAKNDSVTRTAAQLDGIGADADSFGIVFNATQSAGNTLEMRGFTLRFAEADGDFLFDATYTATPAERQRNGTSDYVFNVQLTPQEAASFFGSDNNRVGMLVTDPISNVASGGPDRFFVAAVAPIPEPAAFSIVMLATGAMALRRRRSRR